MKTTLWVSFLSIAVVISCSKNRSSTQSSCVNTQLISAIGTDSQKVAVNTSIKPIVYKIESNVSGDTTVSVIVSATLPKGISAAYTNNVLTISGTPTDTTGSPFSYQVLATGSNCSIAIKGKISVEGCATLNLSNGSTYQSVKVDSSISPLTYTIGGGGTGATSVGLPAGVTGVYSNGSLVISGAPSDTVSQGIYMYVVTTTGGFCNTSDTGYIAVTNCPTITLTSSPSTTVQTIPNGTNIQPITYRLGGSFSSVEVITGGLLAIPYTIVGNVLTISGQFNGRANYSYSYEIHVHATDVSCSDAVAYFEINTQ
ncbi:MAG: hypothetical protein JST75_22495 [Bacteroidetes bacterium]|nr:hypothetical protein [Bacteroidota bacterium]